MFHTQINTDNTTLTTIALIRQSSVDSLYISKLLSAARYCSFATSVHTWPSSFLLTDHWPNVIGHILRLSDIGHRVVSGHSRPLRCPPPSPQHSTCHSVFAAATQTTGFTADARDLTAVSPAECCFSRCPVRYLYPGATKRRDVREMCRPAMTTIN